MECEASRRFNKKTARNGCLERLMECEASRRFNKKNSPEGLFERAMG